MPSGADLAYARMLKEAGLTIETAQGVDGARAEQLIGEKIYEELKGTNDQPQ